MKNQSVPPEGRISELTRGLAGSPSHGLLCPFESLENCVATHVRDWSLNKRDAWIFGIVCGWEDSIGEVAETHGWDAEAVSRLQLLHEKFQLFRHNVSGQTCRTKIFRIPDGQR